MSNQITQVSLGISSKIKIPDVKHIKIGSQKKQNQANSTNKKKNENQTITATKTMRNVKLWKLRNQIQSHKFNSEMHLKEKLPDSHCKLRARWSRRRQISQKNQIITENFTEECKITVKIHLWNGSVCLRSLRSRYLYGGVGGWSGNFGRGVLIFIREKEEVRGRFRGQRCAEFSYVRETQVLWAQRHLHLGYRVFWYNLNMRLLVLVIRLIWLMLIGFFISTMILWFYSSFACELIKAWILVEF